MFDLNRASTMTIWDELRPQCDPCPCRHEACVAGSVTTQTQHEGSGSPPRGSPHIDRSIRTPRTNLASAPPTGLFQLLPTHLPPNDRPKAAPCDSSRSSVQSPSGPFQSSVLNGAVSSKVAAVGAAPFHKDLQCALAYDALPINRLLQTKVRPELQRPFGISCRPGVL